MLEIRLLGELGVTGESPEAHRNLIAQRKRFGLFVYLLLGTPNGLVERSSLLAMFWPEMDERRARQSLRRALHFLRRTVGRDVVIAHGRHTVGVDHARLRCDVVELRRAAAAGDHVAALHAYGGQFMPGFDIPGVPAFSRWLESERSRNRAMAFDAAMCMARAELGAGNPAGALSWTQRAEAIQPEEEDAVRMSIAILHELGNGAAAIRKYKALAERLDEDYEIRPAAQTRDLMTLVRRGAAGPSAAAAVSSPQPPPAGDSLPAMLDALPDAVLQTDLRGRIRYVNAQAVKLTRRARGDLLGLRLVDLVREDYRERMIELLSAQLLDRQGTTQAEFPLDSHGQERWVALRTSLLERPGRAAGLLSTARDVTARRRAEQAGRRGGSRDPLTGLPDRNGFEVIVEERIRLAKRTGSDVVLFSIGLDDGEVGDPLLCRSDYCQLQAARLLRATFRDSDVVARIDDGEFAVVAQSSEAKLVEVVRKRLRRLWEAQRKAGSWPEGVGLRFAALQRASHGRALGEIVDVSGGSHLTEQPVWEILRRSARPLATPAPSRLDAGVVGDDKG